MGPIISNMANRDSGRTKRHSSKVPTIRPMNYEKLERKKIKLKMLKKDIHVGLSESLEAIINPLTGFRYC